MHCYLNQAVESACSAKQRSCKNAFPTRPAVLLSMVSCWASKTDFMSMAFLHEQVHSSQLSFLPDLKLHVLLYSAMPERSSWVKPFRLNLPGSIPGQPATRITLTIPLVGRAVVRLRQ